MQIYKKNRANVRTQTHGQSHRQTPTLTQIALITTHGTGVVGVRGAIGTRSGAGPCANCVLFNITSVLRNPSLKAGVQQFTARLIHAEGTYGYVHDRNSYIE